MQKSDVVFRRAVFRLPALFGFALTVCLIAMAAAAQKPSQGVAGTDAAQTVVLGNSTVILTGPWKFRTGDDMAWAQPGYDDSKWGAMDLTPPPGSYDPLIGTSGFVPGWTAKGYPGYSGYAWYRLKVNLKNEDPQSGQLALKLPDNFDDAYQIYVNGQLVGQFGRFAPHHVVAYLAMPESYRLPAQVRSGTVTIAIRMWMDAFTALVDEDVGGLHGPPALGEAAAVDGLLNLDWDAVNRSLESEFIELAVVALAFLLAFGLFWLDRSEPAYRWLGLICTLVVVRILSVLLSSYTTVIGGVTVFLFQDAVVAPIFIGLWVIFWAHWFRLERIGRLHRGVWTLALLLGGFTALLRAPLYGSVVPVSASAWLSPLTVILKLLMGALLVWVTYRGIQKDRTEGWLALPAVLLIIVSVYQEEMIVLHVRYQYYPFGITLSIGQIAVALSLGIIAVLLMRRFIQGQREREQWRLEIEQAREVQQVLIPEANPAVTGFAVESDYRPAQQVGGDFFQILGDGKGGALIVLGDVTGKGLQAGMLVSLLVGAIRTVVETSYEPRYVLEALNRRLCGRNQAHATCMALHFDAQGNVDLANAGHLAPYLNGVEIGMEGSLPLGLTETAKFEEKRLTLRPGDRLTAMTDGVVEATNATRELFGFDRATAISEKSVAEIAEAAQRFGQEDDITVISVMRLAVEERAPAPAPLTARIAEA